MKRCSRCKKFKPVSEFNFKNKTRGILQSACKTCTRQQGKNHYRKNSNRVIDSNIGRTKKYIQLLQDFKKHLFCTNCEERSVCCLDFHHVDESTKDDEVSNLIRKGQIRKFKEEVEKCMVLCSNCHRKLHAGELILTETHFLTNSLMLEQAKFALVTPLASNQLKE